MPARVFAHVTNHLLAGRLNLIGGDKITAVLVTDPSVVTNIDSTGSTSVSVATWLSDFGYNVSGDYHEVIPTCTLTSGVMRVTIPDIAFTYAYQAQVYGVLFFKNTGTSTTSPLIAIDLFGAVQVSAGLTFNYTASTNGVLRLTIS